jgi:hypothetical protein
VEKANKQKNLKAKAIFRQLGSQAIPKHLNE